MTAAPRCDARLRWACVFQVIAFAVPLHATDAEADVNIGQGPLRVASQSPAQVLRLGMIPRSPSNLASGAWEYYVSGTWVNVWADTSDMKLDYETLTNELIVTYGINEDCQIEGGIYMRSLFGGCMDSFIQGFHRTVGMDEGGRENVGKNQKHIYIAPSQTQPGINTDQQGVPDNHSIFADFTLQKTLLHGGDPFPSVAVEATAGP